MYELDQSNRLYLDTIDSIFGVDTKSNERYIPILEKKKILGDRYTEYARKRDSVFKIIDSIDVINTKELIAITKKYGFPSRERLKVYKAKAYFLFVHSDRRFFPEIQELIEKEYTAKRISEYEKAYIMWNINGRNGQPPRAGENDTVVY